MTCPKCGYNLSPFDVACPRCEYLKKRESTEKPHPSETSNKAQPGLLDSLRRSFNATANVSINTATADNTKPLQAAPTSNSIGDSVSYKGETYPVDVDDTFLRIDRIDFLGAFSRSPNGRFTLAWADNNDPATGQYLLIDGTNIVVSGKMERPNDGKVCNAGVFVLNDWRFGNKCDGVFTAFQSSGDVILREAYRANLFNNGLSEDGRFAVCQTLNSDHEPHAGRLFVFDLDARRRLASFSPVTGWANAYRFDPVDRVLHLINRDGQSYRYSFDGLFVDEAKWLEAATGYVLLGLAENQLEEMDSSELASNYSEVLGLLQRAERTAEDDEVRAKAHRRMGEIYHRCDDVAKALEHLQEAIRLNPKVGAKRLLEKLKRQSIL